MLVLSRKAGEKIVIGRNIVVEVVEIRKGQVRLGVRAPQAIEIFREEIFDERNGATHAPTEGAARGS